ncbi:hypothetical protein B4589_007425 [Halolamina sp. CBA1230]|uniref:hypothetical protein n=1 Tax=Halolamina sp. CBA1230 TaxID=1853690 RepID=UPI0009A1AEFD|nr:hypothetical protein [Halolamina sp. CBA1230]QKY20214.1 hypothetical protein B4589_007425 [Halolamina sp. CBA1230]
MHTRRTFLAGASLLTLSGCLSAPTVDGSAGDLPGGNGSSGETRLEGTGGPAVTLASVDDAPDLPLGVEVTITEPAATEEHPPRLAVSVTNDGDEAIAIGEARAAVFEYQYSDGGFLALLPADGEYDADPGCWRLDSAVGTTMEYRTVTLEPGESHTSDLELYAAGVEDDACLPVGEHRFETTITRYADPEDLGAGEERVEWGFTLLLE